MKDRVRRIFREIEKAGERVDAVALMMGVEPHLDMSFFYATDAVAGGLFERSVALLWPDGRVEVLTSALEEASARKAPEAEVHLYATNDEKAAWLKDRLKGLGRVGVNGPEITFHEYSLLRSCLSDGAVAVDVQKGVGAARLVKDAREIARLQKAADIVSAIADEIPSLLAPGMREFELAAELSYRMQRMGAAGPSFTSIVSFGATSAEPHYHPGDVQLERGGFVLCDFGALYERYASDITRTWVYGTASDEHRGVYATVLRAQEAALAAIRPGAKGAEVHEAAKAVIDASRWKGRFIHSIGHSLGLAVHDGGVLHPRYDLTLEEGMVVTVEPGIYVPGFGGVRIEDDVIVTRGGYRLLTSAARDLREL